MDSNKLDRNARREIWMRRNPVWRKRLMLEAAQKRRESANNQTKSSN